MREGARKAWIDRIPSVVERNFWVAERKAIERNVNAAETGYGGHGNSQRSGAAAATGRGTSYKTWMAHWRLHVFIA